MDTARWIDTRSTIALVLVLGVTALVGYMAYSAPESDAFKIALGAYLSVGFTSIIGWYFGDSAGAEKKAEQQAKVTERLADRAASSEEAGVKIKFAWWSLFTEEEKKTFEVAAQTDGRVKVFIAAAQMGRAEEEDLDYLVQVGALTKDRADFIRAA